MNITEQGLIALLNSAVTGQPHPLPDSFQLKEGYPLLKKHNLQALGYAGAQCCGLPRQEETMRRLFQDYCASILLSERQMAAAEALFSCFEANHIDYMPVKGCNMKPLYPAPGLRCMGDADLLIRMEQYDAIRPLMQQLGYTHLYDTDHELVWKCPALTVELHRRLIPSYNQDYYRYYGDGWKLARPGPGFRYHMAPEDDFIYLFTHFSKHFRDGGIGCRHVLDLWIFKTSHPGLDPDYLRRELQQLDLYEFYCNICRVIDYWFCGGPPDDLTERISSYIFSSGVWGSRTHSTMAECLHSAGQSRSLGQGRLRWAAGILCPSLSAMQKRYPILRTRPALLPLVWVYRWGYVLLRRTSRIFSQLHRLQNMTDQQVNAYQNNLSEMGLRFHFDE